MASLLITHAAQLVTPCGRTARHGREMDAVRIVEDAALYAQDGVITAIGTAEELRSREATADTVVDARGKCLLPGFVDSHTHFLFAGYRAEEFMLRLQGATYLELMKTGGIRRTVQDTRAASGDTLYMLGYERLTELLRQGVTTAEGKSGYGLDRETELRQLRIQRRLNRDHAVSVVNTFLGAHAVAQEYEGNADGYIDWIIETVLPEVCREQLAEFCDVFCETGVFSTEQSEKLLRAAGALGLGLKIHADEINPLGGAELAAELGAASADHLLAVSDAGIKRLAAGNTVATLLPLTAFCLRQPYAPARRMIDSGCAVALASDYNPGSCFTGSIPLLLALAVMQMQMTAPEALTALTLNGAAALGRADSIGSLEVGKRADCLLLQYPDYRFLFYHTGMNLVDTVFIAGETAFAQKGDNE